MFNDEIDLSLGRKSETSEIGTGVCRWCRRAILPASLSGLKKECVWCTNLKREMEKDVKVSERILRDLINKRRREKWEK
jgi:hypothetical protein